MQYKMERKQGNFERGDNGIGNIMFSKDGKKVRVLLQVRTGKDTFESKKYLLAKEDCPDNIDLAKNAKQWMCQMDSSGEKLYNFRPANGAFVVKTQSFASKEGEEPSPKTKDVEFVKGGKTQKYSYEYFTVILEIESPDTFKGLTLPLVLRYQFDAMEKGDKVLACFSMGGKYTDQLEEYMIASGILDDKYPPLDYADNLLPMMQKIALREDRKFQVTVKDGWIVNGSLIPMDEPTETTFDDFDEPVEELNERVDSVTSDEDEFGDPEEIPFDPDEIPY